MHDLSSVTNTLRATKGVWLAFFQEWMKLPYRLRKNLSYHGGIRIQHGEVRMRVHNDELDDARNRAAEAVRYHDPGNSIYALAMQLMWPEVGKHDYNQETIGDISEVYWLCMCSTGLNGMQAA